MGTVPRGETLPRLRGGQTRKGDSPGKPDGPFDEWGPVFPDLSDAGWTARLMTDIALLLGLAFIASLVILISSNF